MSFQHRWHKPHEIVLIKIEGDISLAEVRELASVLTSTYLDSTIGPVHVLIDLSELERFPNRLYEIRRAFQNYAFHPALGTSVLVGRFNPLVGFIAETLAKTYCAYDYAMLPTQAEALAFLEMATEAAQ
jgi:hypothetical protein